MTNFFKSRVLLMEGLHLQPSEIDAMQFWELETTIEEYSKILEERKKQNDQEQAQYKDSFDAGKMGKDVMRNVQSLKPPAMPSMPKMPSIQMPKI